ncbi:hypothetical protein SPBR_07817 [Sporothrix brasiliensis 5110]|uniref:ABM domain-containing protein n=1 Tax=Sporothrix brasiliensis 5110 TaxID=1398154 RepID=A0A0C2ITJ3_9PEZI|nr:uncharacterized protein SPBR_07817 [Sporothrix brasiliensis 5110]KIH88347.1 hypothetical protein SPBR_07817 [Sporothrix brasiliensis 5110]
MTVTEFGATKGADETFTPGFRSATRWLKIDPAAKGANAMTRGRAWLLQQIEEPASVLLAATWADVEQHTTCAATDPDRDTLLPAISKHLYQPAGIDGPAKPLVLVHTEADVFTKTNTPEGKRATGIATQPRKKAEFEMAFNASKGYIEAYTAPNTVRGAWRVDKKKDAATGGDKEEYVLVAGWESRETRFAIADTDIVPKLTAFTSLLDGRESRHDRRLL